MIRRTSQAIGILIGIMVLCLILLAVLPGTWLARQASGLASKWLDLTVIVEDVKVTPFRTAPTVTLRNVSVSATSESARFRASDVAVSLNLPALFKGGIVLDRLFLSDAELHVRIDEQGQSNWRMPGVEQPLRSGSVLQTFRGKKVDDLVLDSFNIHVVNDQLHTDLSLDIEGVASTHDRGKPARVHATGLVNGKVVKLAAEFGFLGDILKLPVTGTSPITMDVQMSVGDDQLAFKGSVGQPARQHKVAADFSMQIASPGNWQAFIPVPMPELPLIALAGNLTRESGDWLLRLLDGQFGSTDISGEVRADSSTRPVKAEVRLTSALLAIDELRQLQIIGLMPLPVHGSIDYRAEQVVSDQLPLESIDVSAVLDSRQLSVLINRIRLHGGEIDGEIVSDLQPQPVVTRLRLNLKRLDLEQLLPQGHDEDPLAGQMAARLALSVTGTTPSSMRSTVDGVVVSLMTGDWLDTVLKGSLGDELAESLMVERGDPEKSGQACAFMELQATEGIVQLRSLVFDTDTIVYLGDGELDWKHESIDLTIEPHYKQPGAAAVADAVHDAVYVSGALSAPVVESVHPFLTRDSAVSLLDATITPAASLMPFLSEYSDGSGVLCQGLAGALDNPK